MLVGAGIWYTYPLLHLPPGKPTPQDAYRLGISTPTGYTYPPEGTWDQRYLPPGKELAPEIPTPRRDLGPEIPTPPVYRMTDCNSDMVSPG